MRTRRPFSFAFVLPAVFLFMAFSGALAVPQSAGSNGSGRSGSTVGPAGDQDNDPDLAAFLSSRIDKGDYLRLRNAEIDMRRGLPLVPQTLNARRDAIEQLDRQLMKSGGPGRGAKLLATFWSAIGPAPIPNGQTEIVTTAVSGRVTCIAVKPTNPNTVYVGTAQGGVYRSLNGGSTWTAIFDNASSLAIGAIAIAPSSPTTLYVGTGEANSSGDSFFGVGLYRIDNSETTADLSGPINPLVTTGIAGTTCFTGRAISKIIVHPTDPATIFVATSTGIAGIGATFLTSFVPPLALQGLYRSTNATSAPGSVAFSKITVTSAASVLPDLSGNRSISDIAFEPGNPNNLLCGVVGNTGANDGGIYRSTNALAATPTFTETFTITLAGARITLSENKVGSTVTVYSATGESSGTLRKSTDGGATWSAALSAVTGFCDGQCWYDIVATINPLNANTVLVGGSATSSLAFVQKKSTNGGTSFVRADQGLHADVHAIEFAPSDTTIAYCGNDGGAWRSTDAGSTWTSINNAGFNATQFQSISVHKSDSKFTIGGTQDNGTPWLQPSNVWTRADYGDGGFALIDQSTTSTTSVTMYHTYFNQSFNLIGFARVTNTACASDGQWVFRGVGFVNNATGCEGSAFGKNNGISQADNVLFYAPMALGPGTPNTLYFGTDRLYRSTDKGDNMTAVSQGPIVSGIPVSAIGISPQSDSVRIVGLWNGRVYATTNASSTLTNITSGSFPTNPAGGGNQFVSRAVIDPNDRNTAYVTFSFYTTAGQGVWKCTNLNAGAGATWSAAGTGIPSIPVNAFVIDPLNSNNLFAGTDIGVYVSTDAGASWTPFGSGLPRVAVFDMAIQNSSRTLRIATHGRGMWEINLDSALPIELASLEGLSLTAGGVRLAWTTISEVNNYGFEVQRKKADAGAFETLPESFVAGHGTTTEPHAYAYTDNRAENGISWYRLKQIDLDGSLNFSEPIMVNAGQPGPHGIVPIDFSLDQNYPNPFNPSTVIRYGLPATTDVRIDLYDVVGRRIATLVNAVQEAGYHEVAFQGENLASGVYVYRMKASAFAATRRFMLLK